MKLAGKAAFVTGGGAGIGAAIADALEREGAKVARVDINGKTAYPCDVADRNAVFATMKRFVAEAGGLDILVNNAVYFHYARLVDMPEDKIHRMLDVGIKGVYWATQAATPHLIARGGGSIINLSSVAVSFGITNASVYTSIKGAIDAFTRQQAVELAPHGIRVNAVAPGITNTAMPRLGNTEEALAAFARNNPTGRLAEPDDIADVVVFLATDDARYVVGQLVHVNGGDYHG
jgi:NAD(P)-dependent dehydrogenase (short-subunit alcohol dehydrogenase family)